PGPPPLVGVDDDLGVGPGPEPVAQPPQLPPEGHEVVDLTVERDLDGPVLVPHRLPARLGEVDDGEPPVAQGAGPVRPLPRSVRARGAEGVERRPDRAARPPLVLDLTKNPTHRVASRLIVPLQHEFVDPCRAPYPPGCADRAGGIGPRRP